MKRFFVLLIAAFGFLLLGCGGSPSGSQEASDQDTLDSSLLDVDVDIDDDDAALDDSRQETGGDPYAENDDDDAAFDDPRQESMISGYEIINSDADELPADGPIVEAPDKDDPIWHKLLGSEARLENERFKVTYVPTYEDVEWMKVVNKTTGERYYLFYTGESDYAEIKKPIHLVNDRLLYEMREHEMNCYCVFDLAKKEPVSFFYSRARIFTREGHGLRYLDYSKGYDQLPKGGKLLYKDEGHATVYYEFKWMDLATLDSKPTGEYAKSYTQN